MQTVKVERKGSYQGVAPWGITGAAEITPSKATAEKWARLENARRRDPLTRADMRMAIEDDMRTPPAMGEDEMEYERRQRG